MSLPLIPLGLFGGQVATSLEWLHDDGDDGSGTSFVFSGVAFGVPEPGAKIFALTSGRVPTGAGVQSSCTIGGVTADLVASYVYNTDWGLHLWAADVGALASGTVVNAYPASASRSWISVFKAVNLDVVASAIGTDSGTGALSTPIAVKAGGFVISGSQLVNSNAVTWSNTNQRSNRLINSMRFTAASTEKAPANGTENVGVTYTGSNARGLLSVALEPVD